MKLKSRSKFQFFHLLCQTLDCWMTMVLYCFNRHLTSVISQFYAKLEK